MKVFQLKKWGFTLIELLIVVAIIAILAAIAVPNFLEAQTRSKVSRCKADVHSMAVAMEAYRVDNNMYVIYDGTYYWNGPGLSEWCLHALTTPIGYMSAIPLTPFPCRQNTAYANERNPLARPGDGGYISYMCETSSHYDSTLNKVTKIPIASWLPPPPILPGQTTLYWLAGRYGVGTTAEWNISSTGPNPYRYYPNVTDPPPTYASQGDPRPGHDSMMCVYDPTNGTTSFGAIWWTNRGPAN